MPIEVPLFPLNTVLFPGGVLPLRIFEPRYLRMIKQCMQEGRAFGVVLISSGVESGGIATPYTIGTLVQVVDFDQLPDGLLGITVRGTERFITVSTDTRSDGLMVAQIESLAKDEGVPLPSDFHPYAAMLEQALPQMGDYFRFLQAQYDDADWVSGRLVEVLPISLRDKQMLLEINGAFERLDALRPFLDRDIEH